MLLGTGHGDTEMRPRRVHYPPKDSAKARSGAKKGFRSSLQRPAQPDIHPGNYSFQQREPRARHYSAARTVVNSFLEHLLL